MNSKMKLSIISFVAFLVLTSSAFAQTNAGGVARYQDCIGLISIAPGTAFEAAIAWEAEGGGPPARHCTALALIALGSEEEGASRLEALAQEPGAGEPPLLAEILAQAASAWILVGRPAQAERVLDRAIKLSPANPDLFLARAEARALQEKGRDARADVDRAIKLNPLEPEAYVFRANLKRNQSQTADALVDLTTALDLAPQNLNALMERGQLHEAKGDKSAARRDYIAVLRWGEEGPSVEAARAALERLDVNLN